MTYNFSQYIPFMLKAEADKKGLSISDLGETLLLTMGKLPPEATTLLTLRNGVDHAVTENELSESNTALTKARADLNTIDTFLGQFAEDLNTPIPSVGAVVTDLCEFIIGEDDQIAKFKAKMRALLTDEEYVKSQSDVFMSWLNG